MSSQNQQRAAGKRFLAGLAEALPDVTPSVPASSAAAAAAPAAAAAAPTGTGRPILGGGGAVKTDLPDTSVHSWNVNVPDFVPLAPPSGKPQSAMTSSMTQQNQSPWQQQAPINNDPINLLISQSLAILAGDVDRDRVDAELNACLMRLYQTSLTREDPVKLVTATLTMAKNNKSMCEPAANLLAFLSVNFVVSQQMCPHLISSRPNSRLANNPIYESLLTVCSAENDRIHREIATVRAGNVEQANYILLFAWLYLYLPSLHSPTQRQGALAQNTLLFLKQLVDLTACPLAFRTVHAVLTAVGAPLDFDCCDPELVERSDLLQLLGEVYDQLRAAVASGRVGEPQVSVDLIRLLELRASNWLPPGAYQASVGAYGGQPSYQQQQQPSYSAGGDVQVMTDDMYADYEQFLRDSGQL